MRKWLAIFLLLTLTGIVASSGAQADEIYTFIIKKQEEKARSRWSLSEWLATKEKMRLMDLWLALHSPAPYEFFLSGAYRFADGAQLSIFNKWDVGFGAYASILGLELQRVFSGDSETWGLLSLRVFGFHIQGTHIALQGGMRSRSGAGTYRNGTLGARMSLYLHKTFGVEAKFHHLFPSTPAPGGVAIQGNQYSGTGFIDFQFLRVYAELFRTTEPGSSEGFATGLKFFF